MLGSYWILPPPTKLSMDHCSLGPIHWVQLKVLPLTHLLLGVSSVIAFMKYINRKMKTQTFSVHWPSPREKFGHTRPIQSTPPTIKYINKQIIGRNKNLVSNPSRVISSITDYNLLLYIHYLWKGRNLNVVVHSKGNSIEKLNLLFSVLIKNVLHDAKASTKFFFHESEK